MGKFILWTVIFLIAGGLVLHYGIRVPYISNFLGKLPGDVLLKKGHVTVFFPVSSALAVNAGLSFISYALFKK